MLEILNYPITVPEALDRTWANAFTAVFNQATTVAYDAKGYTTGVDLRVYDQNDVLIQEFIGSDSTTGVNYTIRIPVGVSSLRYQTKIRDNVPLTRPEIDIDIYCNGMPATTYVAAVKDWSKTKVRRLNITYADKLTSVPDKLPDLITKIRFIGATVLNDPNISKWDMSNINVMENIFAYCDNFNQPINHWNVSNVTNMRSSFAGCHKFNQTIANWNVSKVTDLRNLFFSAKIYNQDLSSLIFKASAIRTDYDTLASAWLPQNKPKFTG